MISRYVSDPLKPTNYGTLCHPSLAHPIFIQMYLDPTPSMKRCVRAHAQRMAKFDSNKLNEIEQKSCLLDNHLALVHTHC